MTGGEPLLQKDVYPLMDRLHEAGHAGADRDRRPPQHRATCRPTPPSIMDVKCPGSGEAAKHDAGQLRAPAAARRGEVRHPRPRRLRLRARRRRARGAGRTASPRSTSRPCTACSTRRRCRSGCSTTVCRCACSSRCTSTSGAPTCAASRADAASGSRLGASVADRWSRSGRLLGAEQRRVGAAAPAPSNASPARMRRRRPTAVQGGRVVRRRFATRRRSRSATSVRGVGRRRRRPAPRTPRRRSAPADRRAAARRGAPCRCGAARRRRRRDRRRRSASLKRSTSTMSRAPARPSLQQPGRRAAGTSRRTSAGCAAWSGRRPSTAVRSGARSSLDSASTVVIVAHAAGQHPQQVAGEGRARRR